MPKQERQAHTKLYYLITRTFKLMTAQSIGHKQNDQNLELYMGFETQNGSLGNNKVQHVNKTNRTCKQIKMK